MPRLFNKVVLSFLASLVILFSFGNFFEAKAQVGPSVPTTNEPVTPSHPNGNWYNQSFQDWFGKVYDDQNPNEIFGERYTAAQVQWVIYGLFSFILNSTSNAGVLSCIIKNSVNLSACNNIISTASAAISSQASIPQQVDNRSLLSLVFATDRPFSGISYVKEKIQKLSLVPVAEAAPTIGFGFTALEPVQTMWKATRDISFGLFVVIAIVFAFMIMFRLKISPQVVISVQSAIPKIIVALILVTFSYAIAGFFVDLMYVVIGLVSVLFAGFLPIHNQNITSGIFNFLTVGQPIGQSVQLGVYGLLLVYLAILPLAFAFLFFTMIGAVASLIAGLVAAVGLSLLVGSVVGNIAIIVGVIIFLIIMIILLWNVIKIIWGLLKAFVNILLLTIFAPLQIVAGTVIPSLGFGSWAKSFISNLAVFVVTGILILFCYIFLAQGVVMGLNSITGNGGLDLSSITNAISKLLFGSIFGGTKPAPSNAWPPLLGFGGVSGVTGLLFLGASFVIFTLIPKTTEIIQAFMSGKPFNYGSGIGESLGGLKMAWDNTYGAQLSAYRKEKLESWARNPENWAKRAEEKVKSVFPSKPTV